MAFHPVAHRYDHVQVVEIQLPLNLTGAFLTNQQEFLVSCFRFKFALFVNVLNMLAYILLRCLKQLGHQRLRQPDGLILQPDIDLDPAVIGFVNQELPLLRQVLAHAVSPLLPVTSPSRVTISLSNSLMSASMTSNGRGGS